MDQAIDRQVERNSFPFNLFNTRTNPGMRSSSQIILKRWFTSIFDSSKQQPVTDKFLSFFVIIITNNRVQTEAERCHPWRTLSTIITKWCEWRVAELVNYNSFNSCWHLHRPPLFLWWMCSWLMLGCYSSNLADKIWRLTVEQRRVKWKKLNSVRKEIQPRD